MEKLPDNWKSFLADFTDFSILDEIICQVASLRKSRVIYPPEGKVFSAFDLTAPEKVKVVIIGQDPYHNPGEAQGLAFSVPANIKLPPSLRNIGKELQNDLGVALPGPGGDLTYWAEHGILLLNSVLSVEQNSPGSHRKLGWENFTDSVVQALAAKKEKLVFILWGNFAIGKKHLIPIKSGHLVIESPHPSPLSANRGFFGSRPFSRCEKFLSPWKWPQKKQEDELF